MSHGTEHHLEEAEHVKHHAHDPFNRRVAMTMAIVAASLAIVTLLSHRAHNETMALRIKANDQWGYYQAKKQRGYNRKDSSDIIRALSPDVDSSPSGRAAPILARMESEAGKYVEDAEKIKVEAEKLEKEEEAAHHRSNFFDLGELGLELGLVLCSIAVLTRRAAFWYGGVVISIAGVAVAGFGYALAVLH